MAWTYSRMRYEDIPDQTQCKYKGITLMTFIIMIVISSILAVIVVGLYKWFKKKGTHQHKQVHSCSSNMPLPSRIIIKETKIKSKPVGSFNWSHTNQKSQHHYPIWLKLRPHVAALPGVLMPKQMAPKKSSGKGTASNSAIASSPSRGGLSSGRVTYWNSLLSSGETVDNRWKRQMKS